MSNANTETISNTSSPIIPEIVSSPSISNPQSPQAITSRQQWRTRPRDDQFSNLSDMYATQKSQWEMSKEKEGVDFRSMRVENVNGELMLLGRGGIPARLTNWAFGQLCTRAKAPANYLGELPASLAMQNLNYGLAQNKGGEGDKCNLFVYCNGTPSEPSFTIRAINGERYTRMPNYKLVEWAMRKEEQGFSLANSRRGRALHGSNHDCFITLINEKHSIESKIGGRVLHPAFRVRNGELGNVGFRFEMFWYDSRCTNGMFFGVVGRTSLSFRHVGDVESKSFREIESKLMLGMGANLLAEEERIKQAQAKLLGPAKQEVIDAVYRMRIPEIGMKVATSAYNHAEERVDDYGDPRSAWAIASSVTELSQQTGYEDQRAQMDRAASRILSAAF